VGSSTPVVDISQPFLWWWDAYPTEDGWAYVDTAGRPQQLVRVRIAHEHWMVEVRSLEFRHFLKASDVSAVLQVDVVKRSTDAEFERVIDEFTNDWARFTFAATPASEGVGGRALSRLLGQYIVSGALTDRAPRNEVGGTRRDYQQFIYGVDSESGQFLRHTCDPDSLGSYFDNDDSRIHYLTPVHFRREVLSRYASEPGRYLLQRDRLSCKGLWGLAISFNTAGLVEVYLGDLGRDLPADEWSHWVTCNVAPEGRMEEGRFRRDFLAEFASSPDPPGELRQAVVGARAMSQRTFGRPLWRALPDDVESAWVSMVGPLVEDVGAFDQVVLLLTKCVVDAIDPAPLKDFVGSADQGEGSLSLLGRAVLKLGGSASDIEPLRALMSYRSRGGVAHLAGSGRDAAFTRLGLDEGLTYFEFFDLLAANLTLCIQKLTQLMAEHSG
jgi:hypothetical protein